LDWRVLENIHFGGGLKNLGTPRAKKTPIYLEGGCPKKEAGNTDRKRLLRGNTYLLQWTVKGGFNNVGFTG